MRKGKSFTSKQYLFITLSPTNSYWILLFVKIESGTLYILDPLKEQASSITISMARDIVNRIIQKKFGATNDCIVRKRKHYFQQAVVSCGVLTCYYAYQIAQGEFIPCFFANLKKRQKTKNDNIHIYECRFKTFYLKLKFYVSTYKCISQIFNFKFSNPDYVSIWTGTFPVVIVEYLVIGSCNAGMMET